MQRWNDAVAWLPIAILATGGALVISAAFTEFVARVIPASWGRIDSLRPSPAESSLLFRTFFGIVAGALVFLVVFASVSWKIAQNTARKDIENQLSARAWLASQEIPVFLETGENLTLQLASDDHFLTQTPTNLGLFLKNQVSSTAFFSQLVLFDQDLNLLASSQPDKDPPSALTQVEVDAIKAVLAGQGIQTISVAPADGGLAAQIGFVALINRGIGKNNWALFAKTSLATNPFTAAVIQSFSELNSIQGVGQLIDGKRNILFNPDPALVMSKYTGTLPDQAAFQDQLDTNRNPQIVYSQRLSGQDWAIVLSIPESKIQLMAWTAWSPLFLIVFIIIVISAAGLFWGLKGVTRSLRRLSSEARTMTQGQPDRPFSTSRAVDEVGQLRDSFEHMRLSLTARLAELNRLLQVSQGVASSLEVSDAIHPILEAAYNEQACLATVILVDDAAVDLAARAQEVVISGRMSIGPASQLYAYLDKEILRLTKQRGLVALGNLTRGRALNLAPKSVYPGALIAVALRHEARFYGALWVGYDHPRKFSKEEVSFLDTLAGEAALAAANAHLYSTAEVGRRRLEAILASTPDPVLVTDQNNRLLLTNQAAQQCQGLGDFSTLAKPVEDVISQKDVLSLLISNEKEPLSREIVFPDGCTYHTMVSTLVVDNKMLGKVCVLRDVTHYKELDAIKSEFVATVSHDLRFPLTLIRGYATMLPMVGDLNEQQKGYVQKMTTEVENISRLVNNLLDLGRIEAGVGLQLGRISAGDIANYVVAALQAQAAQKSIDLTVEIPYESQLDLEVDSALLQQAVYNLVENAVKYTPVHGKVKLVIESLPGNILFSVQDNGIGIAPIDQPRLFEKFYRGGQRDANQISGSGLGLAIVKSIAERHGGRVWLESVLGKGSKFYLEIPRDSSRIAAKTT